LVERKEEDIMKKLRIYYNGKVHEMAVEEIEEDKAATSTNTEKAHSLKTVVEHKEEYINVKEVESTAVEEVEAPMPGRIIKIHVQVGQTVEYGDALMIVEAMKLENEISCESSGVVKEIKVNVGNMVDSGDIVAVIG